MNKNLLCGCGNKKKDGSFACEDCLQELEERYRILQKNDYHTILGRKEMTLTEFLKNFSEKGVSDCGVCAICGKRYTFMGHNPFPVIEDEDARCCSKCNEEVVTPARLGNLHRW